MFDCSLLLIDRMCAIEGHPSLEGIKCGSYRRGVGGPLRMGGLSGNHFQVVIRNMQCQVNRCEAVQTAIMLNL